MVDPSSQKGDKNYKKYFANLLVANGVFVLLCGGCFILFGAGFSDSDFIGIGVFIVVISIGIFYLASRVLKQ